MDKLTAIRTFIQVVELGRFSRAAEAMSIPAARVSQRIKDLEEDLGVHLLTRTTKAMNLTDEGQRYFDACKGLVEGLKDAEDEIAGHTAQPVGRLRVEAISSVARSILAPRLAGFSSIHPDIEIQLGCSDRLVNLAMAGVDCALRGGDLEDSSYRSKLLCNVTFGIYRSPTLTIPVTTPQDLAAAPRVCTFDPISGRQLPWHLERGRERYTVGHRGLTSYDDIDAALAATCTGMGFVSAPVFLAAPRVRSGELVPVLPEWTSGAKPLYAVFPPGRNIPRRLRVFIDWAEETCNSTAFISAHPSELVDATRDFQ